ncbi:hypothetical protein CKM354_000190300 [Cercospora kikuchii]|uniref:F-box domain-containing protein n=1 Tax=Cercospora kikuchii TaxID=84275 RepID=A0A9P3C950_9PEZI|nr:uncharacterized protein CKM354_000190300 [Cercospora kikuchii]GIZ38486.1 hypothetical protein CKM354_000190300 [Cercospora kikuchii]
MKRKYTGGGRNGTAKPKWEKRVFQRADMQRATRLSNQGDDSSDTDSNASVVDLSRLSEADYNAFKLKQAKLARTNAAIQAVISTVELLENIFIHLRPLDIMNATRVCPHWKRVVESSIALRPKLFRTVSTSGEVGRTDEMPNSLFRPTAPGWRHFKPRGPAMKEAIEMYLNGQRSAILDDMHITVEPAQKMTICLHWKALEVIIGCALVSLPFRKEGWTVGEALLMAMSEDHLTSWYDHSLQYGGGRGVGTTI